MKRVMVWFVLVTWMVAGCAAAAPSAAPAVAESAVSQEAAPAEANAASGETDQSQEVGPRLIIKRADLALVVQDSEAAVEAVRQTTEALGGYISGSTSYRVGSDENGGQVQANITVRVPATEIDRALKQFKSLALRVNSENIATEDVTQEYTDVQSRLRNLEATEQELLALLSEVRKRPNATTDDILTVYRRITEVRDEIEKLKGRQQYLDNQVQLATIALTLTPDELSQPVIEPGWRPQQTLRSAFRALQNALQAIADLVIWLVIFVLPVLILIALPFVILVFVIRWLVRRRGRKG
jgi:hypothetical protein